MPNALRETLDQLLALQKVDSEIDRLQRAKAHLDTGARQKAESVAAHKAVEDANSIMHQKSGALKDAELELSGTETKLANYEKRLGSGQLTSAKEIANVEKEIAQLHRQRSALDDKILALLDEVDFAKESLAKAQQIASKADNTLKQILTLYTSKLTKIDGELRALVQERPATVAAVNDPALFKRYETLRARPILDGLAVARIEDMHCSGCRTQVSSQSADRVIDASQIVTCENCGRLLA